MKTIKPTQHQCHQLRGDHICINCKCELRVHVWMLGEPVVGECRLCGEKCKHFMISVLDEPEDTECNC